MAGCSELVCFVLSFVVDSLHVIPVDHLLLSNDGAHRNPPVSNGRRAWITLKGPQVSSNQVGDNLDDRAHDKQWSMDHKLMHPSQPRIWRLLITVDYTTQPVYAGLHLSKKQCIYSASSNWLIITSTASNHYPTKLHPHLLTTILNWMNSTCLICTTTNHSRVWRLPLPTIPSNSMTQNYHSATLLLHPPLITVLNLTLTYHLKTCYNISYMVLATGLVHASKNRNINASMAQMTLNHPTTPL